MAAGGAESSFDLCQGDLPVTICKVQGRDEPGSPEMLYQIMNSVKQVAVKVRDLLEPLEVIAGPGACGFLDDPPS